MKNKVETLKVGERVFVTPIGDVEVMVTKLDNLHLKNAPFKGMEELQIKVYQGGVLKTVGYWGVKELSKVDKDCSVDMEILLQTIDLTINGSDDQCEDYLDKHYQSHLYGMETYNGWAFDNDETPRQTLYWVIGKEIAFTMYLNGII